MMLLKKICLMSGVLLASSMASAWSPVDPDGSVDHSGIARFIKIRWPYSATLAPDQTLYYIHDPDGIRQLYKIPPGGSAENAVKLTSFDDGIDGYSLSHDGKRIAVTAAIGGSEQADLFLMDPASGAIQPLFENPEVVYGSPVWRRDSKAFAYRANDQSPSDFYVYLYDLEKKQHRKVYTGTGFHYPADFSAKGDKLIIGKYNSASYSQIFELTLDSGFFREITPTGEEWSFQPVGYTPDEKNFLVNTNYHRDLNTICSIDPDNGSLKPVLSDLEGHEVDFAVLSFDRNVMAVGVNEDGYRTLHLRSVPSYATMTTPKMGQGIVSNIDFQGRHMLFALDNANTPGIVFKWDVAQPDKPAVALTKADTQGIDISKFLLPKLVHYPSFDGTRIPAFLYLPPSYRPGEKIPFITYYHGGPEGQYRPSFNRSFQYFLSRGYGVIAPNVRGSSGYGKAYIEADNYKNRLVSVRDGVWAAKYVIEQGYTDKERLAAWGGSYGGFMVMAVITEAPEFFAAACNVVGIVNFETFLEQTKAYRRHLREAEYGPLSDPEFLKSISPIYKVDRIETPLMIAHGLNDPRVPVGEAMQVAVALKKRGKDVEELYFPDEGHGFAKEENRLLYYEQMADFFEQRLRR